MFQLKFEIGWSQRYEKGFAFSPRSDHSKFEWNYVRQVTKDKETQDLNCQNGSCNMSLISAYGLDVTVN